MKIDVHDHYFPVEYLDRMDRYGDPKLTAHIRRAGMSSANHHDLSTHFRKMDLGQVDMQVLSISSRLPYYADESQAGLSGSEVGRIPGGNAQKLLGLQSLCDDPVRV